MSSHESSTEELYDRGTAALLDGDLDAAIPLLEESLERSVPDDDVRSRAANNLAYAFVELYRRGGGSREDAVRLAGRMGDLEPLVEGDARDGLSLTQANVILDIWDRWHVVADLRAANALYRIVAEDCDAGWPDRVEALERLASTNHQLDNLTPNLYQRLDRAAESVKALLEVVELRGREPDASLVQSKYNLACALRLRGFLRRQFGDDEADGDTLEALAIHDQIRRSDPPNFLLSALGNAEALCWKDRRVTHEHALDREVAWLEWALEQHGEDSVQDLDMLERNLANALAERASQDARPKDLSRAFRLYGSSARRGRDPVSTALTALNWVRAAVENEQWGEAIEAGESALETWFAAATEQFRFEDAVDVTHSMHVLGHLLATAYLYEGKPVAAAASIDRSRNIAAEVLRQRPGRPAASDKLARDLDSSVAAVTRAAAERTLCYLLITEDQIVTILVGGDETPEVMSAPFDPGLCRGRLAAYFHALEEFTTAGRQKRLDRAAVDAFDGELDTLGRWLGESVLRQLLDHVADGTSIAVIPTGDLAFAPIQVAQVPGATDAQRWLVDRHPLALAFRSASPPSWRFSSDSDTALLLAADPGHDGLDAVATECDAVQMGWPGQVFGPVHTRDAVLQGVERGPLHFACHATFNERSPMDSALHLRDGPLTVDQLAFADLRAPFAFLGACSTGQAALHAPHETISLGHAFNIAGVDELVATSWPVYDVAAAAVATSFYEYLGERRVSVAEALRGALRDVREGAAPTGNLTSRLQHRLLLPRPLPIAFWAGFSRATG